MNLSRTHTACINRSAHMTKIKLDTPLPIPRSLNRGYEHCGSILPWMYDISVRGSDFRLG